MKRSDTERGEQSELQSKTERKNKINEEEQERKCWTIFTVHAALLLNRH